MTSSEDYIAIAAAVNERRLESRNVAHRKVIELAADIADVFYASNPRFRYDLFYQACGFNADDVHTAHERNAVVHGYDQHGAHTRADTMAGCGVMQGYGVPCS